MRPITLSIRTTILLAIIVGMVLPALAALLLDAHFSRAQHAPIVERNRAAARLLAASLVTEPAWTLSEPGLQAAVERIVAEPSVCGVEVLDLQPAAKPMNVARQRCAPDTPMVTAEMLVLHEGQSVARLRLQFDDTEVDQMLAVRMRQMAGVLAAQVVVGMLVLAGVLSVRVLRPINRLREQAGTLASRESMPLQHWPRADELGQLGRYLNEVRSRIVDLIGELQTKNDELHRMAMHDHLTGLPNRHLLRELFVHQAAAARRSGGAMALMFIDLDHFKAVNDTLGHAAGDELLVAISARLRTALRETDYVCRMGGDEFLVLLPAAGSRHDMTLTADRLLHAVDAPVVLQRAVHTARVTASIGIAVFPDDGDDFDSLVRTADLAMYRGKDTGRARYFFFHADIDRDFRARLELERELEAAIGGGQLVLHYQPVVRGDQGRIVGCEALVRWQHPRRGLLMPGDFIQAAEDTGLIRPLGRWTLDTACAQFAAWRDAGLEVGRVAVNVSALQANDDDLPDAVRAAMRRYGMKRGELELELTESALLADTEGALRTIARLREAGAQLSIDDFGTGYSSLSYLKLLKPDKLKIDRSFVRDLPYDADDHALTQAIMAMAQALQITVVAEGVEEPAQRDLLLKLGCSLHQGYLFGKPMPAADLAARLAAAAAQATTASA